MTAPRSFVDRFGHTIELTTERWLHVLDRHQELQEFEYLIPQTLREPDLVTHSVYDPKVRLYYKRFAHLWGGKFFVVVVRFNQRCFLLTAYLTDRIKGGERVWPSG